MNKQSVFQRLKGLLLRDEWLDWMAMVQHNKYKYRVFSSKQSIGTTPEVIQENFKKEQYELWNK